MNKKNILLITYDFPGILSPESIQVQRRAICLANNGHKVFVLTSHENPLFESYDNELLIENENIFIFRTKRPYFEYILNVYFKLYDIADRKHWWKYYAVQFAKKMIKKYNINLLYSDSHPFVSHLVGFEVKKSFPDLYWVAHFSDPWTLNPYTTYKTKIQKNINIKLEQKILTLCDSLTVTSDKTKDLYLKHFKFLNNKISTVPHMFDASLYNNKIGITKNKISIIHTGNIYGLRTIKYLLEVLRENEYMNLEFIFYGKVKREEIDLISKYKLLETVKIYSQISYKKSIDIISNADFLLVVDAPLVDSPFFPSKLVDYIGSNKPIFALTSKKSSTEDILKFISNDQFIASADCKKDITVVLERMNHEYSNSFKNIEYFNMNNYSLLKNIFESEI